MVHAFRKVQSANFMVIKNVLYHAQIEKCKACSLFFWVQNHSLALFFIYEECRVLTSDLR